MGALAAPRTLFLILDEDDHAFDSWHQAVVEFIDSSRTVLPNQECALIQRDVPLTFTNDLSEFRSSVSSISPSVFKSEEAPVVMQNILNAFQVQGLGYYYHLWVFTNLPPRVVSEILRDVQEYLALALVLSEIKHIGHPPVFGGIHSMCLEDKSWAELVNHALDMFYRPFPIILRVGQLAQQARLTQAPAYFHQSEVLDVLGFAPIHTLNNCVGTSWHQLLPQGADCSLIDALKAGLSAEKVFGLVRLGGDGMIGVLSADEGLQLMILASDHPLPTPWRAQLNDDLRFGIPQVTPKPADHNVSRWAHCPDKLLQLLCNYLTDLPETLPRILSLVKSLDKAKSAYSLETLMSLTRQIIVRELNIVPEEDPSYPGLLKVGKLLGTARHLYLPLSLPPRSTNKMQLARRKSWEHAWKSRHILEESTVEANTGKVVDETGPYEKEGFLESEIFDADPVDGIDIFDGNQGGGNDDEIELFDDSLTEKERQDAFEKEGPETAILLKAESSLAAASLQEERFDTNPDSISLDSTHDQLPTNVHVPTVCHDEEAVEIPPTQNFSENIHDASANLPEELPEEINQEVPQEVSVNLKLAQEIPEEISQEIPQDLPQEMPQETPQEILQDNLQEPPIEPTQELLVEPVQEPLIELPIDVPQDLPQESFQELPAEPPQELSVEVSQEPLQELSVEISQEPSQELSVEPSQELPVQLPKESPVEFHTNPQDNIISESVPSNFKPLSELLKEPTLATPNENQVVPPPGGQILELNSSPKATAQETGRFTRSKIFPRASHKEPTLSEEPAKPAKKERKQAKVFRPIEDVEAPAPKKRATKAKTDPKPKTTPRKNAKKEKEPKKKAKEPQSPPEEIVAPPHPEPINLAPAPHLLSNQPANSALSLTELTKLKLSTFFGKPATAKRPQTAGPAIRPQPTSLPQRPPYIPLPSLHQPVYTQPPSIPTTARAPEPTLSSHPLNAISPPVGGPLVIPKPSPPPVESLPIKAPKRKGKPKKGEEPDPEPPQPKTPKLGPKSKAKLTRGSNKKPGLPPKQTPEVLTEPQREQRSPSHPTDPIRPLHLEPAPPRGNLLARTKITLDSARVEQAPPPREGFFGIPSYSNSPNPSQPPVYRPDPFVNTQPRDWPYHSLPTSAQVGAPFMGYDSGYQPATRDISAMPHAPILPRTSSSGHFRPHPQTWEEPTQTKSLRHASILQSRRPSQFEETPYYENPRKDPSPPPPHYQPMPPYNSTPRFALQARSLVQQPPPSFYPYDYTGRDYPRPQYSHPYEDHPYPPTRPSDEFTHRDPRDGLRRDSAPRYPPAPHMQSRNTTPSAAIQDPNQDQPQQPVTNKSSLSHLLN